MAFTTSLGPYKDEEELWENYEVRMDAWSWMAVNEINVDLQKFALVAEIGSEAFCVLKELAFPAKVMDKTYEEMKTLLSKHFKPGKTNMAERLKLHNRKQMPGESVKEYMTALKRIATKCEYGDALDERLM